MGKPRRRPRLLLTVIVVVALVTAAVAARGVLAVAALRGAVAMLGYRLDATRVHLTASSLQLLAPRVENRSGEPVFSAARVDVGFSLRDLLPGSRHRFGLTAVDLEKPVLTLIHHADGSYNVALPGASGPPTRPDATPIDLRLRVRDGVVALIDRFIVPNQERRESLTSLRADAVLAPHDPAYYRIDADLQDGARRYPIAGRGRFDHARLFASQHWYAAELPIGPLIDFAMATHDANLVDGRLRDIDARIYGFIDPDGRTDTHLGARAQLVDGKLFVAKLGAAVGDAHGPLGVYDDGLTTTGIDATLAHVPLRLVGGVYGLAQPQVRFLLTGSGSLAQLRTLAPQIAHRPIDGNLAFALRADGALGQPAVTAVFRSPRMTYGAYALSDLSGDVAVAGKELQIVGLAVRYGPIALRGRGTVVLGDHIDTTVAAGLDGPASAIPYAGSLVPRSAVQGVVVLRGSDSKLAAHGTIEAAGGGTNLDAPFALDADGTGTVGPVALARRDGASLYTRVVFDRPSGVVDAIVGAHRLSLRGPLTSRLPGFSRKALPPIAGTLDADLVGEARGASLAAAAGSVHLRRAGVAGIPLGDADARFSGDDGTVALEDLFVRGPLGQLRADGAYANGLVAAQGRFNADLQRLAPLLHGVRARGRIDAPVRFVASGGRTVVQIADARFATASVQGVALRRAAATIAVQGRTIDVRSARLDAAGGVVVAQGSFGNGGTLRLSTSGIDAAQLRAAGLPLSAGRVVSVATVGGTLGAPRIDAGITLNGGRLGGAPLDALAAGRYAGGRLHLDDVRATYAGAVASASGVVDGVAGGARAPRVALAARVRGADIARLAHDFHLPLRYPQGAIDADVRVSGAARDPALSGDARIAAGSINGLGFRDVVVPLGGDLRAVGVRGGRATFGTTTLGFDASASPGTTRLALRGDRVDLADFNDYFDAADTLSGRGHLTASVALGTNAIATSGDLALQGTQFRRLPIGDLDARWSSRGRTISGRAHVAGTHGSFSAGGSAIVPGHAPLAHLPRSAIDLQTQIAGLDLTTWLPAAGITAPVTGRIDGNARIRGIAPNLAIAGNARLHDGVVGRVPVHTLTLAASFERGHGRITGARLEALNLVADGSGSFGLGPASPLDLALHATSPDVGVLARGVTGKAFDGSGALDATLRVRGSRNAPALQARADLDAPRYGSTTARHAHADVAFGGGNLVARDLSLDLAAGRVALNGSVAAGAKPPFVDRRNAPLAARLLAQHVDLGQFASLLPQGTKLGGTIDGDVAVSGTVHDPQLHGSTALTRGRFVSPLIASEVRNVTLQLGFAGHGATVQTLHADIGGGAVDGSGSASIGDLSVPARTLAFRLDTTEKNVGLDVPRYFRGKVDGMLSLRRDPGAPVLVAGDLTFSHARIPLSALLPSGASKTPAAPPLPIAFDLTVAATTDDRLQSPNVDIGAKGSAVLGGTLAKPTLAGSFDATDGSVSLYRTFTLQKAHVAFDPSAGIIPAVDVTATTHVPNPPTDVLLHAHGPATGLALDLSSRPSYDKAQIIGLLVNAQALGAVRGVASTSPSENGGPNPLQGAALGYVDQQFTRGLFEPFSSSVGKSLGFSSLSLNAGVTGGFSASATRNLGSKLSASFAQSTSPQAGQRQSAGLAYNISDASAFQLTLYDAGTGTRTIGAQTPFAQTGPVNFQLEALAPPAGSNGYVFTFVKKFP